VTRKIVFLHPGVSYCPELTAYREFFEGQGHSVGVVTSSGAREVTSADLIWCLMGFYPRLPDRPIVHEFASLSTAPFAEAKDFLKRILLPIPCYRVFLNEFVHAQLRFGCDVPFVYRDMGVSDLFFSRQSRRGMGHFDYDFVYFGSVTRIRRIDVLLRLFVGSGKTLLLIGEPDASIVAEFSSQKNIIFAGRLTNSQIPEVAERCRFAVNFMPDCYPFNEQTSTKLIEYCALGMPIVSSDYRWARAFAAKRNAKIFFLKSGLARLPLVEIERFSFETPDVSDLRWNEVIKRSGIGKILNDLNI